jgi:diaminopimelate decarboxylase
MRHTEHTRDPRNDIDRTVVMPRDSLDFEPEMAYFRSVGTGEGAVRFIRWDDITTRLNMLSQTLSGTTCVYDLSSESDPLLLERLKDSGVAFSASGAAHLERLGVLDVPSSRISLTAGAPLIDTVQAARVIKPRILSVGSFSALETLIEEGAVPSGDWRPTLQIVVRVTEDQPLVNPAKLKPILERARAVGFTSFGLAVVVNRDLTTDAEHQRIVEILRTAARSCEGAGVTVDVVQILGGLADSQSLDQVDVSLESYLGNLSQTIVRLKAAIGETNPRSQPEVQVEVGQLLVGHFPTFGLITNVKTQRNDSVREVFTCLTVYGDLAGHLYRKTPISIQVLPDPASGEPLSSTLVEAVIHGGTCDSVDSLFQKDGSTLATFYVPENLRGGCLLVVYGKRLSDGATDFNKIPPAQVIIHDRYDTDIPYKRSVLSNFQLPQSRAAERFWNSEQGLWIKDFFRRSIQQIDQHQTVGSLSLGELAVNAELRSERFRRVAQEFLTRNPRSNGTVTFLDLQAYAAMMRNVGRYLRESSPLGEGERVEDARRRSEPGNVVGVDEILLPIKTFCDPIALLCQAATGFGHDAASAGEIWMSAQVGVDPSKVIVSHPHKTPETLEMVCSPKYAPWAVTIDSEQELERLVEAKLSKDTVIFIRFKATGANVVANLSAKFGHPIATESDKLKILELLKRVRDEGFTNLGWAFHVGTQSSQRSDYITALKTALDLTKRAQAMDERLVVKNFNIGGGICDERVARKNRVTGKKVLAGIGSVVAGFRQAVEKCIDGRAWIVAEPGRVTCAAAGFMMSQVIAGREAEMTGARLRWAATRQGILSGNDHDEQFFELMPVEQKPDTLHLPYLVYGSSNRSNDIFPSIDPHQMHMLPVGLKRGDWLMTEGGIAYGWDASGPIDGIDPGQLFAFYTDEQDQIHFIESPWSRRESLRNEYLGVELKARGTAAT